MPDSAPGSKEPSRAPSKNPSKTSQENEGQNQIKDKNKKPENIQNPKHGVKQKGGKKTKTNKQNPPPMPTKSIPQTQVVNAPGLSYLAHLEFLFVAQRIEPIEVITSYNAENTYNIYNARNEMIYFAREESNFIERQFNPQHEIRMIVWNAAGEQIMEFFRPGEFCTCGHMEMIVHAPPGKFVGKIEYVGDWFGFAPKFNITDAKGVLNYQIRGPCSCCPRIEPKFPVRRIEDGEEVGMIQKEWSGLLQEAYTNADNFGIHFPLHMPIEMKAILLGATFLIDYRFFEQKQTQQHHHHHGHH